MKSIFRLSVVPWLVAGFAGGFLVGRVSQLGSGPEHPRQVGEAAPTGARTAATKTGVKRPDTASPLERLVEILTGKERGRSALLISQLADALAPSEFPLALKAAAGVPQVEQRL